MVTIYSVGLYCRYEGGTPFIFFDNEKDAIFLKDFLERYSKALSDTLNEEKEAIHWEISKLDTEFRNYFRLKRTFNFPWKFNDSLSEFKVNQHVVLSLDNKSETLLNKISDFGY